MNKFLRTIFLSLTGLYLATFGSYATAGEGVDVANVMQMQRGQLQADRKVIVAQSMRLTSTQGEKFWTLYDKYAVERKKNGDKMQKLVLQYAKHYPEVPDAVASKIMGDWLAIESRDLKLKKKYVTRFREILKPQQLVRYFQTENKLDAIVNFGLAAEIPLMEKK
ncbi:MAG: hypothetical protein ACC641_05000 [Acidiferrobacterales bacterium]